MADRFRSRLHTAIEEQYPDIYEQLTPEARHSLSPRKQWNVHLQHVGSGKTAVRYLARYVQRSALSEKRLLGYDKSGNILLRYLNSDTGLEGILRLSPHEFIRRWLQHVLPKGFTRIR